MKSQEFKDMEIDLEYPLANKESYKLAKSLGLPTTSIARIKKIAEIISNHNSTLLFTNTREHAEALGSQIGAIKKDLSIKVHHGSLSREIREGVEEEFQAGKLKGIICTSSLELGIDVGSVDYVIQYMSPRGATRLIQRIGRSNHRVEGMPKGCIITSFPDDYLESLVLINRAKIGLIETVKIHEVALDVLAHQICSLNDIVAQVSIASLSYTAVLGLKIARVGTGPPQTGDLGNCIFSVTEIAGAIAFALLVPLVPLEKTLDATDLRTEATGEDGADAGDGSQLSDDRIVFELGGDPVVDLVALGFEEADVIQREVEDTLNG